MRLVGRKFFSPLLPGVEAPGRERAIEAVRKRRIVHGASLTLFLIFCNKSPSERFSFAVSIQKQLALRGAAREPVSPSIITSKDRRLGLFVLDDSAMRNRLHFISGLPRSGSTLLAALLRQNPRFSAGMSSPVYALFDRCCRTPARAMKVRCSSTAPSASGSCRACSPPTMPRRPRRRDFRHQPGLDNQIAGAGRAFPRRQSDLLRAQSRMDPRQR
jgi:hypothetical protein